MRFLFIVALLLFVIMLAPALYFFINRKMKQAIMVVSIDIIITIILITIAVNMK